MPPSLALVASVSLAEAMLALGATGIHIKWPNDLMLGPAKAAGILLERVEDWVVIGFGVNLVHAPDVPDRVAASLLPPVGVVSPARAAEVLAAQLAERLRDWRRDVRLVVERWTALAHPLGTALRARLADGNAIDGAFDGLTPDGALRLRLAAGGTRVIHAGDVFEI